MPILHWYLVAAFLCFSTNLLLVVKK